MNPECVKCEYCRSKIIESYRSGRYCAHPAVSKTLFDQVFGYWVEHTDYENARNHKDLCYEGIYFTPKVSIFRKIIGWFRHGS